MSDRSLNILVSPLNWGLGHATRMIPVIRHLQDKGHNIVITSYGESYAYLKREFPFLIHEYHQGISITYPEHGNMALHMALRLPGIFNDLLRERRHARKMISKHKIDLVISDNRYLVRSKGSYNVIITHQTSIKSPVVPGLINRINHYLINCFDECWIPDDDANFSGDLSDTSGLEIPVKRIGLLSTVNKADRGNKKFDLCFLISGPEPQRTRLAKIIDPLLPQLADKSIAIITSSDHKFAHEDRCSVFYNAEREKINDILLSSRKVISRPGYSTIMDLAGTGIKALFIPTPGQTEQEYLAKYLSEKNISGTCRQDDFNLTSFRCFETISGFIDEADKEKFVPVLDRLLSALQCKRKH